MAWVRPMCLNAERSRSSLWAAMTGSSRAANSRRSSVKVAASASRAAPTACTGVAGPGAAAIALGQDPAVDILAREQHLPLVREVRKKVILVTPARSAIWLTVVAS